MPRATRARPDPHIVLGVAAVMVRLEDDLSFLLRGETGGLNG